MIIDAHTHYTTAPLELQAYRGRQITDLGKPAKAKLQISDEQLERSMQGQFKRMQESGIDRLLFSPQASAMGHHFGTPLVSRYWTEACNDLIARVSGDQRQKSVQESASTVGRLVHLPVGGDELASWHSFACGYLSVSASTPGSFFPSRNSKIGRAHV